MLNAVHAMLPRLLTGKTNGIGRMLNDVRHWNEKKINEEFDKIPERYNQLYNDNLSSFGELTLYTEIISFFREQDVQFITLIKEAQKRVILSHNSQFKNESSNSKLSEES